MFDCDAAPVERRGGCCGATLPGPGGERAASRRDARAHRATRAGAGTKHGDEGRRAHHRGAPSARACTAA
ncbi:hypothetical protein DF156_31685 [Burkholderia ubonensis]|uniref:Uncharacterized protein n=1 Tax=Burkholderia ubonensis TaxID=101571 RepID=A0AB74D2E1_9BURK|nr:hypothetical protein CJO71_23050 [Burkholderia ubonensis]PAJ84578.1 hypothetical protein CJO70_27380 [Burkholderia ubonensis]PAJ92034.1 hypothetical protein CJO69_24020 [Burkholderia ubonensis]PAJ99396.1 hypothetical protein CJO68_19850 [Burkholderia ubonensis]PAK05351.1 hypothetical protein CJO67_24460 [Burkholderia ubonensis]